MISFLKSEVSMIINFLKNKTSESKCKYINFLFKPFKNSINNYINHIEENINDTDYLENIKKIKTNEAFDARIAFLIFTLSFGIPCLIPKFFESFILNIFTLLIEVLFLLYFSLSLEQKIFKKKKMKNKQLKKENEIIKSRILENIDNKIKKTQIKLFSKDKDYLEKVFNIIKNQKTLNKLFIEKNENIKSIISQDFENLKDSEIYYFCLTFKKVLEFDCHDEKKLFIITAEELGFIEQT